MRVEQNMMLRGSIWNFRLAVPKSLRALREQTGLAPGPREIWQSLKTSDQAEARRRLPSAIEGRALQALSKETEAQSEASIGQLLALAAHPRARPTWE